MRKCDSCGKIITDERDIMCPHCGAVSTKSSVCTHSNLEDRWNRDGAAYSFHGENTKKVYSTDPGEEEINSNKPFSFGSTVARNHDTFDELKKAVTKTVKTSKAKKKKPPILFIIIAAVIFINIVIPALNEIDFDGFSDSFESYYDEVFDKSISVDSAVVSAYSFEKGTYSASLSINELYGDGELCRGDLYFDVLMFDKKQIDENGYSEIGDFLSFAATPSVDFGNTYDLDVELEANIVYYMQSCYFLQDDSTVWVELPFDAFMLDKNGTVFYYDVEDVGSDSFVITPADISVSGFADSSSSVIL